MRTDTETIKILDKALKLIEANLNHWNQQKYHCGITHCLAGFCDLVIEGVSSEQLSNYIYDKHDSNFANNNTILNYLFHQDNDMDYIARNIQHLKNTQVISGIDSDGMSFNDSHFNKNDYKENNYDEDGFDKYGFDEYGFDENNFDENNFDENGYDKNGFNEYGLTKDDPVIDKKNRVFRFPQ